MVLLSNTRLPGLRHSNQNPNRWAKVLLYAHARWGKTNLARTCPKPFVIATELGDTKGLQTLMDIDVPFVECETIDEVYLVVQELASRQTDEGVFYQGEGPFETVINDSLTATGELWMQAGMRALGWEMVWDYADKKDPRQVYPYVAEKGRQTMKLLMSLSSNLLVLAREGQAEEGTGTNRITYAAPELPGAKLPRELPGWPDATLRGVTVNNQRYVVTRTIARAVAGFRVPPTFEVPELILPNMEAIFRLTTGDRSALDDLDIRKRGEEPPKTPTAVVVRRS